MKGEILTSKEELLKNRAEQALQKNTIKKIEEPIIMSDKQKPSLDILNALAKFEVYLRDNFNNPINLSTVKAYGELYLTIVDSLNVKEDEPQN